MSLQDRAVKAVAAVGSLRLLAALAIVIVLLGLSLWGNITQWADHRAYVRSEKDRLEAAANKAGMQVSARLATGARRDNTKLLDELQGIAERGRKTKVVYRNAATASPLPAQCAPGQARMDAVNAGADK